MTATAPVEAPEPIARQSGGLPGWVVTLTAVSALAISIATLVVTLALTSSYGAGRSMMGGPGMMGVWGDRAGATGSCIAPWGR